MRTYVRVLALVCLILACTSAMADPLLLQYKFTPGEVEKYRMAMNMRLEMPGVSLPNGQSGVSMAMVIPYTQKTLGVLPDGSAKVKMIYGQPTISGLPAGAKTSDMAKIAGTSVVMTISRQGRIISMSGLDQLAANSPMKGMDFSSLFGCTTNEALFPDQPVEVGQCWKQAIPLPFVNSQLNVTTSLDGYDEEIMNRRVARINQYVDGSIDLSALMKQIVSGLNGGNSRVQTPALGNLEFSGNMKFYFAPSIGKLIRGGGNLSAALAMAMPAEAIRQGAPRSVSMTMKLAMSISRLK